jgi:hypothetical protein
VLKVIALVFGVVMMTFFVWQAQYSCNCGPFIPYLAVNFMDRFISRMEIPV